MATWLGRSPGLFTTFSKCELGRKPTVSYGFRYRYSTGRGASDVARRRSRSSPRGYGGPPGGGVSPSRGGRRGTVSAHAYIVGVESPRRRQLQLSIRCWTVASAARLSGGDRPGGGRGQRPPVGWSGPRGSEGGCAAAAHWLPTRPPSTGAAAERVLSARRMRLPALEPCRVRTLCVG